MIPRLRPPIRNRGWLFAVIAMLALAAQIAVALAPLSENRERSMSAHIESGGAKGHFTHDDATCAACQARSIAGTTSVPSPIPIAQSHAVTVAVVSYDRTHSSDIHLQQNPRAPPRVI